MCWTASPGPLGQCDHVAPPPLPFPTVAISHGRLAERARSHYSVAAEGRSWIVAEVACFSCRRRGDMYGRFALDDLETVERELLRALQLGDVSASAGLLRDDFLITTAGWLHEPAGKRTWLEGLIGRMTLEDFDLRLIATRRYGDVAVVLAESRQKGTHDGAPFAMTFRYTDVWIRGDAGWRLATRHASGIPSQ